MTWPEVLLLVGTAIAASRWLSIETAPRDGSLILAANRITGDRYVVGWKPARDDGDPIYGEDHWDNVGSANAAPSLYFNAHYFTHWQHLPPKPAAVSEGGEDE